MKTLLASYQVIIKKDTRTGTNSSAYSSYVPELGIAADGDTIEETVKNTKQIIKFHLESLIEEGESIPENTNESFIVDAQVTLQVNKPVRYA
ncbi:hypothetical protein COW99_04725 [Candidatus Roizmanbacteria bacterium CG22_combo_CG10-13_8_21_14_all_38_20]|uniref:HicB-like antitoxin of toxin-antitoxin system domain-containing protein n=1 Tax=Candidatus Roizmanbacteria bacterium CG22_combo_CG10-13_8_21_14_all_38_20 TaxID=1974862 RepID=A0A2H0BUS0_9BACT|nr:type II toxin-antitoxin system HicB family antitoxin [Candidatus Microgenomates bacterium]PIP61289.1 MAG: hypothetical protein COW99_04725 [Candidatus Roizmanbacteria bacterium CG22_combo_CG10-13_8_21_14_all_38_20]PJC31083.1 MAG: hypothetical protein CO050_04450 [Candidatus Roizmanbacteria bacterium CG_4_9_14_0_2_um_filter_38_17]